MALEVTAVVGREIFFGEARVGENLPGGFVVEVSGQRGDDAVLAEKLLHGANVHALFFFFIEQVANFIVAVADIDLGVFVPDFAAPDVKFGGIGMHHGEAACLAVIVNERFEFVGSIAGIFWIDKAEGAVGAADGFEVIENFLNEHIAQVEAGFEVEVGGEVLQDGHDGFGDDLFAVGHEVNAADTGEVRLDKVERVFPHGAGEVDHGIEAAKDGVVLAVALLPGVPQPFFLVGFERHGFAHVEVLDIQVGQAFEGVDDGERDDVEIGHLVGHDGERAEHEVDDFLGAVAHVGDFVSAGLHRDALGQALNGVGREAVKQLAHTAIEAEAFEAAFVGGVEGGGHGESRGLEEWRIGWCE